MHRHHCYVFISMFFRHCCSFDSLIQHRTRDLFVLLCVSLYFLAVDRCYRHPSVCVYVCHFYLGIWQWKIAFEHFDKRIYCSLDWHLCSVQIIWFSRWSFSTVWNFFRWMHMCCFSLVSFLFPRVFTFDLFRHFGLTIAFVFGIGFVIWQKPSQTISKIPAITLLN